MRVKSVQQIRDVKGFLPLDVIEKASKQPLTPDQSRSFSHSSILVNFFFHFIVNFFPHFRIRRVNFGLVGPILGQDFQMGHVLIQSQLDVLSAASIQNVRAEVFVSEGHGQGGANVSVQLLIRILMKIKHR